MPRFDGIRVTLSGDVPDPGYKYVPDSGFMCRPDKMQELTKKINAAHIPGDAPATDEQIRELVESTVNEEPN